MSKPLTVELTSFSYKMPIPAHMFSSEGGRHGGGFVFDCRVLPNPGREERYKSSTGLDADVKEYLRARNEVLAYEAAIIQLVTGAVENYLERDFEFLNISFGCTGGQHRSVFFADEIGKMLKERFGDKVRVVTEHVSLKAKGFLPTSDVELSK